MELVVEGDLTVAFFPDIEDLGIPAAGKGVDIPFRASVPGTHEATLRFIMKCNLSIAAVHHGEALLRPEVWDTPLLHWRTWHQLASRHLQVAPRVGAVECNDGAGCRGESLHPACVLQSEVLQ